MQCKGEETLAGSKRKYLDFIDILLEAKVTLTKDIFFLTAIKLRVWSKLKQGVDISLKFVPLLKEEGSTWVMISSSCY